MPPASPSTPDHFALRSIVVGGLISVVWFQWQGHSWGEALHVVDWSLVVEGDGTRALDVLPLRCVATLALVLVAMLVSASLGLSIAFGVMKRGFTRWLAAPVTLVAQFIAALPVVGLAWCGIAWLVNAAHLPIESLIPYIPPPELDSRTLALGRALWAWLVPMWVLAVPLTGMWLGVALDQLRALRPLEFQTALEARGLSSAQSATTHWFCIAGRLLGKRWHGIGMIAFAMAVFVEDTFGLPGCAGFAAHCVRERNIAGAAAAMNAFAWLAALWHLIAWPIRRLADRSITMPVREFESLGYSALILPLVLAATVILPWTSRSLPSDFPMDALVIWPRLISDVHQAGIAVGVAALGAIGLGWWLSLTALVKAMPRLLIVDTLLASPLIAIALPIAALDSTNAVWHWPALLLTVQGGAMLRNIALRLQSSAPMLASRIAGSAAFARWWRHGVPELAQALSAWALRSLGDVLLGIVLIRALVPDGTASLGNELAAARDTALTHPDIVLHTTWVCAFAVLCFWRLSRVLRAALH